MLPKKPTHKFLRVDLSIQRLGGRNDFFAIKPSIVYGHYLVYSYVDFCRIKITLFPPKFN